jgi:hypothetical protein
MTVTIKKSLPAVLLLTAAVLVFVVFFKGRDNLRLQTFRTDNGWGYAIFEKDRVFIRQPYIPAIEGKRPFNTKSDARKAGRIIMNKLNKGSDPSVTKDELNKAGIRI